MPLIHRFAWQRLFRVWQSSNFQTFDRHQFTGHRLMRKFIKISKFRTKFLVRMSFKMTRLLKRADRAIISYWALAAEIRHWCPAFCLVNTPEATYRGVNMALQSNLSLTPFFRQVPSIERCQSVCNFFGPNLIRHIMWLPAITSHGTAIHQTLAYSLSSQFKWQPVEPFSFNLKRSRETFERALLIRRPAIKKWPDFDWRVCVLSWSSQNWK